MPNLLGSAKYGKTRVPLGRGFAHADISLHLFAGTIRGRQKTIKFTEAVSISLCVLTQICRTTFYLPQQVSGQSVTRVVITAVCHAVGSKHP